MNYILKMLLTAVAVLLIEYLLPGVTVDSYYTAVWVAVIIGVLYSILKPILVVLSLPVTILTLGLFLFVINALIIIIASKFIDGFNVSDFWSALFFSILLSIVQSFLYKMIDE